MAEQSTQARPYARAVFELAQRDKALGDWSEALAALAAVVGNDDMQKVLGNPRVPTATQVAVLREAAGDAPAGIADKQKALIDLLEHNGRLRLLPALAEQFEALKAQAEGRVGVHVVTAVEPSKKQLDTLAAALHKRLDREVDLSNEVDADIRGGFIVRAGDLVIDQSVQGRLDQLALKLAA